jgi:cytochrome bd-type quinol oxidase subunit 1/mono/diheme cytochrome c family protein
MHYPWWYVPDMTAPMLIAAISVVHVLVSHYAVGGGLFLAVEVGHAYKTKNRAYLDYLYRHAAFFILLTVVFGGITGVGIWWTIGLASPLATEWLIRIFVFGWATEWVFFVLELAAAFLFFYYWGRLTEKTHVILGWIYALAAWISLVLITGITAFMLNPGDWVADRSFWSAFFNPEFLPQTVARTGGALLLSSLYVYLHASLTIKDAKLRDMIGSRSTRPALLGAFMITVGGIGWYAFLPESARTTLESAAVLNVLMMIIFALTVIVFFLLYLGPYKNPGWLTPGFAIALFIFGLAAFSTGEFIREAVRKPFVSYNVVLSNQILPEQVEKMQREGYLENGVWTKQFVKQNYPELIEQGKVELTPEKLEKMPHEKRVALGEVLFQYHCNDCHAIDRGYSAVAPLLRGKTPEIILPMIRDLHKTQFFMPPWCGTDPEAHVMTDYLISIAPKRPEGMRIGAE